MAVSGDSILAIGSNEEIQRYHGSSTKVIDLGGKLAVPGWIEGHGHFTGIGQAKMNLDLRNAKDWDVIVAKVAAAAKKAKPGEWILGRGWHQKDWNPAPSPNVEGFPVHKTLSEASPNNPVMLVHASGHASFVNAKAIELVGIDKNTAPPSGGDILKDADGNPTGLLRETAQGLVRRALEKDRSKWTPEQRNAELQKQIDLSVEECLGKGITTFEDAGSSLEVIQALKKRVDEGRMGLRLWVMIRAAYEQLEKNPASYKLIDFGDKRLTVRAIKQGMDGALGPRGAWLLEPYDDLPTSSGLNTQSIDDITKMAELAMANGFQLCVHAIGDRANRETLNIYEKVFHEHPDKKDLRWRIEHSQHLSAADIPRFGQLGVIAAMQANHCTSDAPYVLARLGPKRAEEGAYVWQKLMKSGAIVTNGTDAPVEDVNPIGSFYAAVSRKLKDGSVFYPDQRMSRMDALMSYTILNAFAAFEEKAKGSLTPGKLADVTVLSKDIMTVPEDEIPSTQVVYTIVGGKVMYQNRKPM
ncbi:MAG: amidohydrolase [Acidobacteria bacterium]|nr:amidohydrolase [Acidobacteriota bacterium]